jgi:hypothetical protein
VMTRVEQISKEAAIVQRALKRSERNHIPFARSDRAREMSAVSGGFDRMTAGVVAMLEHAEVRAAG